MKTALLFFLLMGSVSLVFAQAPCPERGVAAGTNMGAGDCTECAGTPNVPGFDFSQKATAKVVLEFEGALPCIPRLLSITNEAGVTLQALCGVGTIKSGDNPDDNITSVEYCFWTDDEFFKDRAYLTATIRYDCNNIVRTCPLDGSEEIPLPVHFKSFNATRSNSSSVSIRWTTAFEQNNKGFNIQKNVNGEWRTVAYVPSQASNGNSSSALTYNYVDVNTEKGITQYRIQQVDLDGKFAYTDIRAIRGDGNLAKVVVYPNPSSDGKVNIVFEDNSAIRDVIVSDMQGKIVRSFRGISNNILVVEKLTTGFYTLKVTNRATNASSVHKVVIK
jgi:hypothetical protein